MADIYNPNKPQDDLNQPGLQQPVQGIQPISSGPNLAQPGVSRTVSGTGGGGTTQPGSGAFTNFQKYIDANQNTNIGGQLGEKIQGQANQAQGQIGQAQDQVKQQLASEQNRLNQGTQLNQQIQQDPTQLNAGQTKQFQQIYGGQYNAPNVDLSQAQQQTQHVQQLGQQAGTEQGRFGLLQQFYGRPTYNTGQQRLDQLLLQSNPQQSNALQTGAQNASHQTLTALQALQGQQTQAQKDVASLAGQKQTEAQNLIGNEQQGTGVLGGLVGQIKQETQAKQDQAKALQDVLTKAFSGQGFSSPEEQAKALQTVQASGIDPTKIKTYDIGSNADLKNPSQFINNLNITPEAVASEQEKARLNALYNITGITPSYLTGQAQSPINLNSILNQGRIQDIAQQREASLTESLKPFQQTQQQLSPLTDLQKQLSAISGDTSQYQSNFPNLNSGFDHRPTSNQAMINAIDAAHKNGLSDNVVNALMGSKELRPGSGNGSGMHAESPDIPTIMKQYMGQLNEANKQVQNLPQQYGMNNTLADLLSRYTNLSTQGQGANPTPLATGGAGIGKIGLL